jgi:hypothetical protein
MNDHNYVQRQKKTADILSKKGKTAAIIRDFEGAGIPR